MEPPVAAAPAASGAAARSRLPRYRFVTLGVVWSAYLVVFLSRLCVGPLAPYLKSAFDLNNAQIGGLTSATAVAYAPTLIFAGWLVDRIGVRRALLTGTVITGVCIGAVALAPSYGTMLLLLGASGLGCGFIYPTAVKAIMLWFPARERATAVGVNQSAVNVSGMLGAAIMPALAVAYGWQAGFVFAAGLAFVVCVVAVLLYRDPRPGESPGAAEAPVPVSEIDQGLPAVTGDAADGPGGAQARVRRRPSLARHLDDGPRRRSSSAWSSSPRWRTSCCSCNDDWGYSVAVAAGMLAFCQFAGALGKPLSGLVSDRLLRRRRVPALLAMGTLAGLSCVALRALQPGQPWLLWGVLFLLGFGAVGWGGLMGTLAGETGGHAAAGAAAGVSAAFFNVGIFFGPPLFGFIVDATGAYTPAWWTMAASAGVALVLLLFVREGRPLV